MNQDTTRNPWRRLAIGISLMTFFIAVYFVTFNGYAISRDEWFLFDATESMARRGDMRMNYEYDDHQPISLADVQPAVADTEPLQPVLAVPLFWLAQALPGIGLVHTVWAFNILVTALTIGTFYAYGLALGYRARVAALAALALGLGTILWPYSRTFFREPLFTWLALLSLLLARRLRLRITVGQRPLLTLIAFVWVVIGALFSKEAALLILPVLAVELAPSRFGQVRLTRRRVLILGALAALGIAVGLVVLNADTLFGISSRYEFTDRIRQARENLGDMSNGVIGYMLNPERSLWLFSPVLLLGFGGWPRLVRQHRWRQIVTPLIMLLAFTFGYAIIRGVKWSGGFGWGARYMVPVVPVVALWLLPLIESLLERGAAWWARLGTGLVFLFSLATQVLAALVPVDRYYAALGQQQAEYTSWLDRAWTLRWFPVRLCLDLLGDQDSDLAWQHAVGRAWLLPVVCGLLVLLALGWLVWWVRRRNGTRAVCALTLGSTTLATALTLGLGLIAIRQDPRYYGDFRPTRDLLSLLDTRLQDDDAVVLNDFTYSEFFMNYYKRLEPVIWTLPLSPGERTSPEQPPERISSNPGDLIHPSVGVTLGYLGQQHDRLWLVINSSPFIPWSVRPVERYLVEHYFPVSEIKSTDTARAVLFDMTPAPPPAALTWPEQRLNATFGDSLRLVGVDIPGGLIRSPGDVLPVSLLWQAVEAAPLDYTVGLFLMSADGQLIAQHDSPPVYNFEHTQSWRPGSYHRDNHGMQLPAAVPPGDYALWAVIYWWQTPGDRLPVTDANGDPLGDHAVLATVTIE
ncbi:MAG: hypothetical protein JXJ20_15640 [Anaerolineae bacterium]|nr:hypothetical protein [Anaerolineae bacterium]